MKHHFPLITAHSGCEGTADNSMASIEAAIALGADCAEIDVHVDGGGRLWLTHDAPERFEGLVALEEAFARVRESGIGVNCDIKRHAVLYPTLALAERVGVPRDQRILSGAVGVQLLREDAGIARRARVFLNIEELAAELLPGHEEDYITLGAFLLKNPSLVAARLRALGAEALNAPYRYTDDAIMQALRAEGVALSLWTIDDADDLRAFMGKELLNITTRNVRGALAARRSVASGNRVS